MLGVFQDVAKGIADHAVGQLATFDMMFEGLRTVLKSQIQSSIINAERNITNPLAVRLLKALFLVKYVREFKPTVRNLCVLMLDRFGMDLGQLQTDVEEALNLLENQVYIQRNGELYEFLTDEEKDVEQEIKNTEVDTADIAEELSKIIFDQVIRAKKLRYDETRQDYPFTRKEAASRFENHGYNDILSKVTQWTRPPTEEYRIPSKGDAATAPTPAPAAQFISLSSLNVDFSKPWLESEPDVDAYIAALKQTMMLAISENKHIRI